MESSQIYSNELYHYGILGMKWGIRRYQNKDGSLTPAGKQRYAEESNKKIQRNKDGSSTIPAGFKFNRVGKASLDINKSGGLYVSYGKEDAARYVKSLGPTTIGKLLGQYGEAVQHITVKKALKMPSNTQTAKETAELLLSNENLLKRFNESIYSFVTTGDFDKNVTKDDLYRSIKDPNSKNAQKLSYGVSSFLGDENYADDSKIVYEHFRNKGYDAIPDIHDLLSGTSKTAMIVINPNKVEVTSVTMISKDVMKSAKSYVKTLEKLKVSDLIKD